ncbi:MAG: T9SS type A sorting domain-containing protein [Aureispira sp.]
MNFRYKILSVFLLITSFVYAQPANDSCNNATSLMVQNPASPTYTTGSFVGATQTTTPCSGATSIDIWYTFSALSTGVFIFMPPISGGDLAFEIFDACNGNSIACVNNNGPSMSENYQSSNFVAGQTYWIKVYLHNQSTVNGAPSIAVMDAPPPANDACNNAVPLALQNINNPTYTTVYLGGATPSSPPCSGSVSTDVWYTFTAASTGVRINIPGISAFNPAFEILDACNGSSIACVNNHSFGVSESYYSNDFVPGQTYWVKVFLHNQSVINGTFNIAVMDVPPPINDSCNNAITLFPQNTLNPVYTTVPFGGATYSTAPCSGNLSTDVWYSFTATSNSALISMPPKSGFDPAFELLDACNGNSIACVDNNSTSISESYYSNNFVPGQTYWIKVFLHNQSTYNGSMDIVVIDSAVVLANGISVQGQGGATAINTPNGTLQMEATLTPNNLTTSAVSWTITNGANKASISPNGVLTALADGIVRVKGTTMDGTNLSDSIDLTITNQYISVNKLTEDVFSIYPNPVAVYLNIESSLNQSAYIQIVDVAGGVLYSKKQALIKGTNPLNLASLNLHQGIYFLRIEAYGQKSSYFKFVKK